MLTVEPEFFNSDHRVVWKRISENFRQVTGTRLNLLIKGRQDLGFVQYTPPTLKNEFETLIGLYNRVLRRCSVLTMQEADEMWPFFRYFHCQMQLEKLYPFRAPSLEIMKKEFDNAVKSKRR